MEGLHEMEEELEVELDAYKDFDELKPWWCEGLLQERTDKNGSTKFLSLIHI